MFSLTQQSSFVRGTAQVSSSSGTSRRVSLSLFFLHESPLKCCEFYPRCGVRVGGISWFAETKSRDRCWRKKRTRKRSKRMRRVFNRAFLGFDALILVREYRWKFANHRAHLMKTSKSRPMWWPPLTHFSLFIITCIIIKRNSPILLRP